MANSENFGATSLLVQCVIFGFSEQKLKVLLTHPPEAETARWFLPQSIVHSEEMCIVVKKLLKETIGCSEGLFEQFQCFYKPDHKTNHHIVSVVYFALIDITMCSEKPIQEQNARWFDIGDVNHPDLHQAEIILMAKQRLKECSINHPVYFALLPNKFTLRQLQVLCESIHETEFDKRNFIKRILNLGMLVRQNEKEKEHSKKGSFYYKLKLQGS